MLDNAFKYEEELEEKFMNTWYDDKYKFYYAGVWHEPYKSPKDDWHGMCFVSLDKYDNILGLISYDVDRITDSVRNFGAINFSDNKATFGIDLCQAIDDIFCKFNLSRIEFNVVIGNPIESSYDKMVQKYGGRIVGTRKKVAKLIDNKLYDDKIYEILREDYMERKNNE